LNPASLICRRRTWVAGAWRVATALLDERRGPGSSVTRSTGS